jgi:cytochrome c553
MKKVIFLIASFLFILFACTTEKKQSFLSTDNIRTQTFNINPAKDNRIVGVRGGIFTIPAGAFDGTTTVTIELKEIYAPIEILAAGLSTESNGELLESGGMFYINAKRDGKDLVLRKEINGSIPSNYINDSMKLFTGEVKEDGNVNWIDPVPLKTDTTAASNCIETGRRLFLTNCASCHGVNKKLTGPGIAGADKKVPRELYYDFIHNPAKTAKKSSYYSHLIAEYEGIIMTGFPGLSNRDIDCIIDYANAAVTDTSLFSWPGDLESGHTSEPCGFDTTYIDEGFEKVIENALAGREDTLARTNNENIIDTDTIIPIIEERYIFEINTLGWYNIDILIAKMEGIDEVTIDVTTDFPDKDLVDVKLYFPEKRISGKGFYNVNTDRFTFGNDESRIPLFIGDIAILFSIAKKGNQVFYDVIEFRVDKSQTLKISLQPTTEEELQKAFEKINLDNINLDRLTKKPVIVPVPCNNFMPAK